MRMNVFRLTEDGNYECLGMFCTDLQIAGFDAMYPNITLVPCNVIQVSEQGELMDLYIEEKL